LCPPYRFCDTHTNRHLGLAGEMKTIQGGVPPPIPAPGGEFRHAESAFRNTLARLRLSRPVFSRVAAAHAPIKAVCFKTTWVLSREIMAMECLTTAAKERLLPVLMLFLSERVSDGMQHQIHLLEPEDAAHTECSICRECNDDDDDEEAFAVELNTCHHRFHLKCIARWFLAEPSSVVHCPMCRSSLAF
jgi:hypothetical protein